MVQTSISAWLKKPQVEASATQPQHVSPQTEAQQVDGGSANANATPNGQPTPPPPRVSGISTTTTTTTTTTNTTTRPQPLGLRPLPPNIILEPLTSSTINSFRRLNALLLPIPYPDSFYHEILNDETISRITLGAFWHDIPPTTVNRGVETSSPSSAFPPSHQAPAATAPAPAAPILIAAIRCRLLSPRPSPTTHPSNTTEPGPHLYISTLGTLSPYRTHGAASHLLAAIISSAFTQYTISAVTAHVWEANTEGLEWYLKRGFEVVRKEEGYYRRLSPSGALFLKRGVGVGDVVGTAWRGGVDLHG